MDNWTGSLSNIGAMRSANQESGAYHKCGSVDSDIVTYVNRYEIDDNKVKTVRRAQKATHTPLPLPFPSLPWRLPGFEADIIDGPLPSAQTLLKSAEAEMGIEMTTILVPTLHYVAESPKDVAKPQCKREYKEMERI
jgi:hypothetical protein